MVNTKVVVLNPSKLFPELVVSFLSFGFFIAVLAYPVANDATRSKTLITLLIITSILSGAAGFIRYATDRKNHSNGDVNSKQWSDIVKSFLQPSRTTFLLLHGPAAILLLYLTARLYAVDNFRTQPTNLDFGPKYGRVESDGSYENNIAFTPDFDSAGHFVQGFLAALLSFPAVSGWIARKIASIGMGGMVHFGRARLVVSFITLAYSILTIYPTYNLIKRIHKHYPIFASTSYANNSMEWAMGYTLGLALGMCLTSLMRWLLTVFYPVRHSQGFEAFMHTFDASCSNCSSDAIHQHIDTSEEDQIGSSTHVKSENNKYAFGKMEEYTLTSESEGSASPCCHRCHFDHFTIVTILSNVFLATFSTTVLLCGIYMGTTWNTCTENDGDECINSAANGVDMGSRLVVAFIMTFMAIEMVFIGIAIRMHGPLI